MVSNLRSVVCFCFLCYLTDTASSHKWDHWISQGSRQRPLHDSQSGAFRVYTCARHPSVSRAAFWSTIRGGREHDKRLTGSPSPRQSIGPVSIGNNSNVRCTSPAVCGGGGGTQAECSIPSCRRRSTSCSCCVCLRLLFERSSSRNLLFLSSLCGNNGKPSAVEVKNWVKTPEAQ